MGKALDTNNRDDLKNTPETDQTQSDQKPEQPKTTDIWEHKYKTLQGKYNAEIGRLQEALRNLQAENEALKTELNTLKEMMNQHIQPQNDPLENIRDTFPELYDVLKQLTSNYVRKDEMERLRTELASEIKPVIHSSIEAQLSALVPDWMELNSDPEFINWLQQKAPYSTKTLHELMLEAYNAGDARTVAQFFIDYKKQRAPQPSQGNISPVGRQVQTQPPSPKPVIRREEIAKFYRDCALGKYTPEQKAKKEAEIKKAIQEGRVVD